MRGKNRERCDTAKEQERRTAKIKERLEYVQIIIQEKRHIHQDKICFLGITQLSYF